jgi:hypothetical protein
MPVSASAATTSSRAGHVVPLTTVYRHNVSAHTSDYCAQFSGTITYSYHPITRGSDYVIDVDGTLSNHCNNNNATLYLSYVITGTTHESQIGKTTGSLKISKSIDSPGKPMSQIHIFVCTNYNGYRCSANVG